MAQAMRQRQATSERWQRAAARAAAEGVEVRQVNATGQWVATSGTRGNVAYIVSVTRGVAHECTCEAGLHGDPVCKHRAAFYLLIGALDLPPEPDPPALGVSPLVCLRCRGTSADCPVCQGAGVAFLSAQAAALRAAA